MDKVFRRTKIIATLGPSTDDDSVLHAMIAAGEIDLVRLNFSHGTQQSQISRVEQLRRLAKDCHRVVGLLADIQGPKIRIACFAQGSVTLESGNAFTLDAALGDHDGDAHCVGVDYKKLPYDVVQGDTLLLDDGRLQLTVTSVDGSKVHCRVEVGGVLSNHKGINRYGGGLSAHPLTEKDRDDIACAVALGVNYIALSFPRHAEDVMEARALVDSLRGERRIGIIAKIERAEAVKDIDAIVQASDGVMVARGDLAVEIGDAEVPLVRKIIIKRARHFNKPVIIATQMMESMIESTVPTRAEVSDVANAVLENVDAVMLSAETAVGKHPKRVVAAMARICHVVENNEEAQRSYHRIEEEFARVDEAIAMATMYTANHLAIRAIIALTESGATPLMMSRIRTGIAIYGLSRFDDTLGMMTLYRGVQPLLFDMTPSSERSLNQQAADALWQQQWVAEGDRVILTKGDYLGQGGGTNAMKILTIGTVV